MFQKQGDKSKISRKPKMEANSEMFDTTAIGYRLT